MPRRRPILIAIALLATLPSGALAQLEPVRAYFGVNRPAPVRVTLSDEDARANAEIALFDPAGNRIVDRSFIDTRDDARATGDADEPGVIDLASVFPILWTARQPRMLYAQLVVDERPVGAPVVLEPLLNPRRFEDRLTSNVADAFARRDAVELTRLLALTSKAREGMVADVVERPSEPVFAGRRAYVLRDVILDTSEGSMRVALEPLSAPRTVYRFLTLVEGGFYRDMAFHRVISADASGLPFLVQTGDPTGTGRGGSGELADFERSTLAHTRGVLSMARLPDDPNTNGSQFFICLSREACSKLDGKYTSFATVVEGLETLDAIASTPLAPAEEEGPTVPQRPIHPPVLRQARAVDAAPVEIASPPVREHAPTRR